MTDDTFERINMRLKRNFASYINIVYTGKYNFQDCFINRDAADKLKSLSKKEKWSTLECLFVFMDGAAHSPILLPWSFKEIKEMT